VQVDLSGQNAVVTGGTRGIGAAISRALLQAGARVVATYHRDQQAAEAFRQGCDPELAGRLELGRFDVADPEAVRAFFAETRLEGGLQVLVNNAGVRQDALLGLMPLEAWERVLAVNLSGAFLMCKHAVRAMISGRYGRIVNVTSPSGRLGLAGQSNYAASKAGLVALTRSLAREVATRGITVNCVSPGFVETDLLRDLPAERLEQLRDEVPMRRFGLPGEVAGAVLYLASPGAAYVTGAVLPVTGGL
jgi:3-oxoacyl-[acyl-carrier protein] reductase